MGRNCAGKARFWIAGQKPAYLLDTLTAYALRKRSSGVMSTAASRIDPATMRALANHYAGLSTLSEDRPPTMTAADVAADRASAERIVDKGMPELDLPACAKCHAAGKRPDYPILAGQKATYLAQRLRQWRGDPNVVDARKPTDSMPMIARRIPENMIEPLARLYAQR